MLVCFCFVYLSWISLPRVSTPWSKYYTLELYGTSVAQLPILLLSWPFSPLTCLKFISFQCTSHFPLPSPPISNILLRTCLAQHPRHSLSSREGGSLSPSVTVQVRDRAVQRLHPGTISLDGTLLPSHILPIWQVPNADPRPSYSVLELHTHSY